MAYIMDYHKSYDEYKIPQLKEELKKRNLSLVGKKQDLINRLMESDTEIQLSNGIITIFIKHYVTGSFKNIYVDKFANGDKIYELVAEKYGYPVNELVIYLSDNVTEIDKNETIVDQGINHESTLVCFVRMRKR